MLLTRLAVLAVLATGRSYGLEILQTLGARPRLVPSEGTIYPLLNRLRREGLAQAEWVESDSGHPRKYYSLTREGRERAARMAKNWVGFSTGLTDLVEPLVRERKDKV
jgi:PadR family transcriptional regulator PadR